MATHNADDGDEGNPFLAESEIQHRGEDVTAASCPTSNADTTSRTASSALQPGASVSGHASDPFAGAERAHPTPKGTTPATNATSDMQLPRKPLKLSRSDYSSPAISAIPISIQESSAASSPFQHSAWSPQTSAIQLVQGSSNVVGSEGRPVPPAKNVSLLRNNSISASRRSPGYPAASPTAGSPRPYGSPERTPLSGAGNTTYQHTQTLQGEQGHSKLSTPNVNPFAGGSPQRGSLPSTGLHSQHLSGSTSRASLSRKTTTGSASAGNPVEDTNKVVTSAIEHLAAAVNGHNINGSNTNSNNNSNYNIHHLSGRDESSVGSSRDLDTSPYPSLGRKSSAFEELDVATRGGSKLNPSNLHHATPQAGFSNIPTSYTRERHSTTSYQGQGKSWVQFEGNSKLKVEPPHLTKGQKLFHSTSELEQDPFDDGTAVSSTYKSKSAGNLYSDDTLHAKNDGLFGLSKSVEKLYKYGHLHYDSSEHDDESIDSEATKSKHKGHLSTLSEKSLRSIRSSIHRRHDSVPSASDSKTLGGESYSMASNITDGLLKNQMDESKLPDDPFADPNYSTTTSPISGHMRDASDSTSTSSHLERVRSIRSPRAGPRPMPDQTPNKRGMYVDTSKSERSSTSQVSRWEVDVFSSPFDEPVVAAPPLPTRPTKQEISLAHSPHLSISTAYTDETLLNTGGGSFGASGASSPALPPRPITPRIIGARSFANGELTVGSPASAGVSPLSGSMIDHVNAIEDRVYYLRNKETFYHPDGTSVNRRPPVGANIGCVDPVIRGAASAKMVAISNGIVVSGYQHVRAYNVNSGEIMYNNSLGEMKISAIGFPPTTVLEDSGKILWVALHGGEICEYDSFTGSLLARKGCHTSSVLHMIPSGSKYLTLDDQGGLRIWYGPVRLKNRPRALRVLGRPICATITFDTLWCACGKTIEIYNYPDDAQVGIPTQGGEQSTTGFQLRHDLGSTVGNVTVLAASPTNDMVFSSHDDGKVIVWNSKTLQRIRVVSLAMYKITSMLVPSDRELWVGYHTGKIDIIRMGPNITDPNCQWRVVKGFHAYPSGSVEHIFLDVGSLILGDRVIICTLGDSGMIRLWDGLQTKDWIDAQLKRQVKQYCNLTKIKTLICSWNCNATKPSELESGNSDDIRFLRAWLSAADDPDIIVIGLQELVNLESKTVNAKEILRKKRGAQPGDHRVKVWRETIVRTVKTAYPENNYYVASIGQMMGLFQCILIKEELRGHVYHMSMQNVKTGMGGYHGNKGGIATRFAIDDSSVCFVNCHLAAHQNQVAARNNDAYTILKDANFPLVHHNDDLFTQGGDGRLVMDHEFVFFSGDLNYRIDLERQRVQDLIEAQQWDALHQHDQLLSQMNQPSFALYGFEEGKLDFAPTFKYDIGFDRYDTSEKRRVPSWCDRILFKGDGTELQKYGRVTPYSVMSDHRPIIGEFTIETKRVDAFKYPKFNTQVREGLPAYIDNELLRMRSEVVSRYTRVRPEVIIQRLHDFGGNAPQTLRAIQAEQQQQQ